MFVNSERTAAVIWLLGATVYVVCEAVAAASTPGYSYLHHYISDLGGSMVMNVGAFVAHGMLFVLGALVLSRSRRPGGAGRGFVIAAAFNTVGNVMIAVFPSGQATSEPWHVIGAAMAILGGNIAVILAGIGARRPAYRRASVALGVFGILCLGAVVMGAQPAGLVERGSVYSIIGWELFTAGVILRGCSR